MDGNLAKNRQAIVQAGMPSPALGSLLAPLGDPPALRMLNLQNLFRNDTRSVGEAPLAPATFPQGFPSRGRLDGLQRKANRKHIIFKEPTDHLQSGHVALLTFLSSFSENHSSSAPKALLRGLTPPASPGKATQLATESAPQASFLSTLPEPSFHPPACHFLAAPPGPSSQWVPDQLIFPARLSCFCGWNHCSLCFPAGNV